MTENRNSMDPDWIDPDDAPDLSAPEWQAKIGRVRQSPPKQIKVSQAQVKRKGIKYLRSVDGSIPVVKTNPARRGR